MAKREHNGAVRIPGGPPARLPLHAARRGRVPFAHLRGERQAHLVITQNGEAKVVLQDIHSFEQAQETIALLKILALGNRQIEEGKVVPAANAIKRLRKLRESR